LRRWLAGVPCENLVTERVRDGDFSHIDMDFIERVVAPRHELGGDGALPFAVRGCLGLGTHG
jgi:hypothetical protein